MENFPAKTTNDIKAMQPDERAKLISRRIAVFVCRPTFAVLAKISGGIMYPLLSVTYGQNIDNLSTGGRSGPTDKLYREGQTEGLLHGRKLV